MESRYACLRQATIETDVSRSTLSEARAPAVSALNSLAAEQDLGDLTIIESLTENAAESAQ